jgi:enoyl-CoA hydratase
MASEQVEVRNDGTQVTVTINRPQSLNALNYEVLEALDEALLEVSVERDVRVMVLRGAGSKAFVAGADIAAMHDMSVDQIQAYATLGQRVVKGIENLNVPVVAVVDGYALGGGLELALACDLIVARADAKVGQPEVNLGVIPGFGGSQRLIQRCGLGFARRLVLTGEVINAELAFQRGVVDVVFALDGFEESLGVFLDTIKSKAPLALSAAKRAMNAYSGKLLADGLQREVDGFVGLFHSEDKREGMGAFLEKRPAVFKGR